MHGFVRVLIPKSRGIDCFYLVYTGILHIVADFHTNFFVPVAKSTWFVENHGHTVSRGFKNPYFARG